METQSIKEPGDEQELELSAGTHGLEVPRAMTAQEQGSPGQPRSQLPNAALCTKAAEDPWRVPGRGKEKDELSTCHVFQAENERTQTRTGI